MIKRVIKRVIKRLDTKTFLQIVSVSASGVSDSIPHDSPWDFEAKVIWGSFYQQKYIRYCSVCPLSHDSDVTMCVSCGGRLVAKKFGASRLYQVDATIKLAAHELFCWTVEGTVVILVSHGPKIRECGAASC